MVSISETIHEPFNCSCVLKLNSASVLSKKLSLRPIVILQFILLVWCFLKQLSHFPDNWLSFGVRTTILMVSPVSGFSGKGMLISKRRSRLNVVPWIQSAEMKSVNFGHGCPSDVVEEFDMAFFHYRVCDPNPPVKFTNMANTLSAADVLFDCIHYAGKIKPPKINGMFGVGVTLRNPIFKMTPSQITDAKKAKPDLAPSVANTIKEFVAMDGFQSNLPAFKVKTDSTCEFLAQAWSSISPVSNVKLPKGHDDKEQNVNICVSTVDHENGQLEWGRVSKKHCHVCIPLCDYEEECEAQSLRGNQGPLGTYLTPSQQELFDETGEVPEGPYFCLLCIRRDIHAYQLAYSSATNSHLQAGRGTFVIPPFKNIVNAPGGYHESVMSVKEDVFMPIPVFICGVSGTLQTRYDPVRKIWFVDQGSIVFQGDIRTPHAIDMEMEQGNQMDFH